MMEARMKKHLAHLLAEVLKELGISDVEPVVEISSDQVHGEYTTNIALQLGKQLKRPPMDIALQVKEKLLVHRSSFIAKRQDQTRKQKDQKASPHIPAKSVLQDIEKVEVVAPGFINFFLTEAKLSTDASEVLKQKKSTGKGRIMVEFAHPNTHKAFHIGHLRNITTGESIVRLLESSGKTVIRVNYQGDVGMHIAKCLYGILHDKNFDDIKKKSLAEKMEFLGQAYAAGNKAFEESEEAKKEIGELNKKIYAKDSSIMPLYEETRTWSLDYFDAIYNRVGSHFDRLYFESECFEEGKKLVMEGVKTGIFKESDGAIIFPGEKHGLHNRVFITKDGNATYEGKEIALAKLQFDEYHPDRIIHVVGPEQAGYFQVLFKALEQVFPQTTGKEYHLIYGWVKLKHGKMSSRTGNVVLGEWLIEEAKKEIYNILQKNKSNYTKEEQDSIAEKGAMAAVKYAFLKVSTKQEIAFDLKESVSFEGDSGPYLQYTYARCKSVLRKAKNTGFTKYDVRITNNEERSIARLIHFFPEIVSHAATSLSPSLVCPYLFKLAQAFNLFYQKHPILGSEARLALTATTAQVLSNGLYLLGIETIERM